MTINGQPVDDEGTIDDRPGLREAAQQVMDEHRKGYWSATSFDALEAALRGSPQETPEPGQLPPGWVIDSGYLRPENEIERALSAQGSLQETPPGPEALRLVLENGIKDLGGRHRTDLARALDDLVHAALRGTGAETERPKPGTPCPHHRDLGFTYSVLGCPKCYPDGDPLAERMRIAREAREEADHD